MAMRGETLLFHVKHVPIECLSDSTFSKVGNRMKERDGGPHVSTSFFGELGQVTLQNTQLDPAYLSPGTIRVRGDPCCPWAALRDTT